MKTRTQPDPRRNLVGFTVGDVRYAVGVELVRQVVNPTSTTPLPHMPGSIVGVAEHRGVVIPVVDLRLHFGLPAEETRRTKWILLELRGDVVGIVVDSVTGVFGAMADEVRPAPSLGAGDGKRGLTGVASQDGHLVFLLDAGTLRDLARPAMNAALPEASTTPEKRESAR